MSRLQLALNVADLDEAIAFYSAFFRTEPSKVQPGYANFAIEEPPLKLVLFENAGAGGTINHLGVEVFSSDEVTDAATYLQGRGLNTEVQEHTTCCFAVQDKLWVQGPDDQRWEVYTVLADDHGDLHGDGSCCDAKADEANPVSMAKSCC
jgi:catechol 2,3-dioxygenase-like lactoylglutathione lyase family enzyme